MVQPMVALLPEPVMPSSVWNRSPRVMPSASAAMAAGWSPAGSNGDTICRSGTAGIRPDVLAALAVLVSAAPSWRRATPNRHPATP
jgi:hypothetical protein